MGQSRHFCDGHSQGIIGPDDVAPALTKEFHFKIRLEKDRGAMRDI